MDSPEDSRAFARDYGIAFPLLSDADGAVSRQYTGVTSDDNTLPGVVIVRDGEVAFRQLATAKDDRLSTSELLAALDRTLGTHGPGLVDDRYRAIDRLQLRLDVGGGGISNGATGVANLTGLVPLGHYLVVGPRIGYDLRAAPLALGGVIALRLPVLRDTSAFELGAVAAYSPFDPRGAIIGGVASFWFAWSPKWSLQLGAEIDQHRAAGTFGIGRLLEF